MSQAEPQADSEDVQSSETSSGIVITNGPDGLSDDDSALSAEDVSEDKATESSAVEGDSASESDSDPGPDADTNADADADAGVSTEPNSVEKAASDTATDESEGAVNEVDGDERQQDADAREPEVSEDASPDDGSEPAVEESSEAEAAADPEMSGGSSESASDADQATSDDTNSTTSDEDTPADSDPNMSTTESNPDAQSAGTEPNNVDLYEIEGAPSEFEATIEVGTLQKVLDSVNVLVDECKVRLGEDRMCIRAVDPANVGMVDVELAAGAFESYYTSPGLLGLNLEKFIDVVKLGNKGDLIHLDYDSETQKLHINVGGIDYTLALIDPGTIRQEPDIPDLELPAEVSVESGVINQGIRAADMVSDHIALGTQQDGTVSQFVIEAEGDTDDIELVKREDADEIANGRFSGDTRSLFSLDYLKDMNKALPKNAIVTLELGDEFPLKIHFEDDDGQMDGTYMLAPRIQSD